MPIDCNEAGRVIEDKAVQLRNAWFPIERRTDRERSIPVKEVHCLNAYSPIFSNVCGNDVFKEKQSQKANPAISCKLFPKSMSFSLVQPAKAPFPIFSVFRGSRTVVNS